MDSPDPAPPGREVRLVAGRRRERAWPRSRPSWAGRRGGSSGREPLPVRQARRRRHRSPAARRHAVPDLYYLTCPRATGAVSTLESAGVMRQMQERLETDPELDAGYRPAHLAYVAERADLGQSRSAGTSAGGMPDRVKCLHVLVAHALADGPGVNPLGDEALAALDDWWAAGPCTGGS